MCGRTNAQQLILQIVDALGDEFKPAMHACWLAYIQRTYPYGAVDEVGQGPLVLDG
jgi:hypothetical protein